MFCSSPAPELAGRGHPAYLSEGKGRRRRSSGKENKEADKVNMINIMIKDDKEGGKVPAININIITIVINMITKFHVFSPGERNQGWKGSEPQFCSWGS